ncbi:MAG: hypothetical protein DI535_23440 [Citrobacter freundii]|nr:MAG: hypothetical protein DI535_23440 [Citrobacter freundii]
MLTNEQIQELHAFCYKHSVRYYDVQVELVDHLANAIEAQMEANPQLTFEDALRNVYKGFGVMGFGPLVAAKQKAVDKQARKQLWRSFRQQFRWPAILLALMVFALCYSLLQLSSEKYFLIPAISSLVVMTTITIVSGYRLQKLEKASGKKFLLLQFRNMLGVALIPLNLINVVNLFRPEHESMLTALGIAGHLLVSGMFTFFVVMSVATWQVFKNMEVMLRKGYPEVFGVA